MGIVCATARCSNSQTSRTWGRRRFIGTASVSSDGIKTSGTPLSPMAAYRRPWNSGRVRLSSGHASHLSRSEPMLGAFEFQPAPLHYSYQPVQTQRRTRQMTGASCRSFDWASLCLCSSQRLGRTADVGLQIELDPSPKPSPSSAPRLKAHHASIFLNKQCDTQQCANRIRRDRYSIDDANWPV